LLHSSEPVKFEAVNRELPQLSVTDTMGVATTGFTGAAVPLTAMLVHPFTVWVTLYVPAADTVIDGEVAPVLHNNEPVYDPAVNTEFPQLFTTVIVGMGVTSGAATPLPGKLVLPLTVCVTVYVPALVTVIEEVVSPVLHSKEPV
jgi:hypothetical protein